MGHSDQHSTAPNREQQQQTPGWAGLGIPLPVAFLRRFLFSNPGALNQFTRHSQLFFCNEGTSDFAQCNCLTNKMAARSLEKRCFGSQTGEIFAVPPPYVC